MTSLGSVGNGGLDAVFRSHLKKNLLTVFVSLVSEVLAVMFD